MTFLGVHIKPFRRYVKNDALRRMRLHAKEMAMDSPKALGYKSVQERLLAQANSMLGVLAHARSYRLRRELFGSYPMYTFACGSGGMVKFIMNSETKQDLCQVLKKN